MSRDLDPRALRRVRKNMLLHPIQYRRHMRAVNAPFRDEARDEG